MCGIAGILSFKNNADEQAVKRMTKAMAHRGPDAEGLFAEGPLAFGHLRLSIIDLSEAANQPFKDASGRYIIVFNGEIYNYRNVKQKIQNYPFHTSSDTEVILAHYIQSGPSSLTDLRGMFAFAVWDKQNQELFIARDRMGVKPLYYYKDESVFVFASEIRGLLASGAVPKKINQKALPEYFSYQSIGQTDNIIQGVSQLEAGCWMKVTKTGLEIKKYWNVSDLHPFNYHDINDVQHHVREMMLQSVERRLVADVPVGAFLSGGIDSSAIVGLMAEAGSSSPNTFTVAFEEKDFDESEYAGIIARKFKTNHTNILLQPNNFLEELPNALQAMDSPSGDGINTYVVSKAIRKQGMRVALSGVGGDELFAGYPIFKQYLQLQHKSWLWKIPGHSIGASLLSNTGRNGRIKQLLRLREVSIDQVYPVFRQILSPSQIKALTKLPRNGTIHTALQHTLHEELNEIEMAPLLSQVSIAEYLGYTQHTLLKDTDQMSMAVSLEVREPFFDHDLVEFVLSIPDQYKKPAYPKSLLVESLKPLLPDEIVFRKKKGFLFPWELWLRNELRSFCSTYINQLAGRSFINGPALQSYWKRFQDGDTDIRWVEIWLFVVLGYWMEKNEIE